MDYNEFQTPRQIIGYARDFEIHINSSLRLVVALQSELYLLYPAGGRIIVIDNFSCEKLQRSASSPVTIK